MRLNRFRGIDLVLAILIGLLVVSSIAMIYSLTIERTGIGLARDQALFALLGVAAAGLLSTVDYRRIRTLVVPSYAAGVLLLILVLVMGKTVFGATRWIDIAGFQFQPSEPMKLLLILFVAHLMTSRPPQALTPTYVLPAAAATLVTFVLVLLQPDLGTAMVLGLVTLAVLGASQLPRVYWLSLLGVGVVLLPILWSNLHDYQLQRIQTFLQPTADPLGTGYNVIQSLIAVGNGGLMGQGFGQGTQSQLDFLPVVHTDFIFAGIAESIGFVGSILLLGLFVGLLLKTLSIARQAPDRFGMLVAIGIASLWFIQFTINVSMTLGLAPVTGIPLPFVSYGGTALITNLAAAGILASIAARAEPRRFRS